MAFLGIGALFHRSARKEDVAYRELVDEADTETDLVELSENTTAEGPARSSGRHVTVIHNDAGLAFFWKVTTALLSLVCVMQLLYISVIPRMQDGSTQKNLEMHVKKATPLRKPTPLYPKHAVFDDLTEVEITRVRDYVISVKEFNLVRTDKAKLTDNFIYLIEVYLPRKQHVLDYLYGDGKKPVRRAKVVLVNGAKDPPNIEEYLVEPVENPSHHTAFTGDTGGRSSVPFARRPFTSNEHAEIANMVTHITEEVYPILRESFNAWLHNCTDKCLIFFVDGLPASFKATERTFWIAFMFRGEGFDLLTIPFQLFVDVTDPKSENWKLMKVYYNKQFFDSIKEFVHQYSDNKVEKIRFVPPKQHFEDASFRPRGTPTTEKPMRGPQLVEPDGPRYSVSGRHVTYLGWEFHIGMRAISGSALYDVRFNGSRIAYEISAQEASSFYSSHDPRGSVAVYLDSALGLGIGSQELIVGRDCPFTATVLDATYLMDSHTPVTNKRSVCVFEHNNGIPLRRHYGTNYKQKIMEADGYAYVSSLTDHVLVVRHIATAENYDFVFDYMFHQNGVIEVKVSTAGYVLATSYYDEQDPFSVRIFEGVGAPLHDHYILYRVDLDVDGTENTYKTLDIKTKTVTPSWDTSREIFQRYKVLNTKARESEAILKYNFSSPKQLLFTNEGSLNSRGVPKSYRIQPKGMVKQLFPDDYPATRALAWTKYQLAVTKYKEEERVGASAYNLFGMEEPIVDFDSFLKDDENIEQKDVVAWVTVGGLHVPNTEDIPTTFTSANTFSFAIRPFGFYNYDPSMNSRNVARISKREDGHIDIDSYGLESVLRMTAENRTILYN